MKIYFDNAATTPLAPEVLEAMLPYMKEHFGNPSSIHAYGRQTRAAIEEARKTVSRLLNCSPSEIFFTSGGTEANNMAIHGAVADLGIQHVVSSPIEHHAVLHTLEYLQRMGKIKLSFVSLDATGHVDLSSLDKLLAENEPSLVSLMHANNEVGNLLPVKDVGELCKKHKALFHSDTVQTVGHYQLDLQTIPVHFMNCGAHKFHGPKGVGFIYIQGDVKIRPFLHGGSQERNMRAGTENLYGIVGLAKALELMHVDMEQQQRYIQDLTNYMIEQLIKTIPGVEFNGDYKGSSLYTVLNVSFPPGNYGEMLLFSLDIAGIAASGGSACASGSTVGSHVLTALQCSPDRPAVRFSFSKHNTKEEIDFCVKKLSGIIAG